MNTEFHPTLSVTYKHLVLQQLYKQPETENHFELHKHPLFLINFWNPQNILVYDYPEIERFLLVVKQFTNLPINCGMFKEKLQKG